MKRCITCLVCFGLLALAVSAHAADAAGGKTRILLTFGGHGFDEKPFFAMFDAMPDVGGPRPRCPSGRLLQPGLEKEYDCLVMYDMVAGITPEQQEAFVKLLSRGSALCPCTITSAPPRLAGIPQDHRRQVPLEADRDRRARSTRTRLVAR